MKDLKHYFTSPVGSDNEVLSGSNEIIYRKRKIKNELNSLDSTSAGFVGTKKRRKKKNLIEESEQDKSLESNPPKPKKKRRKTVEEVSVKKPRISKLCENVNIPQKAVECNEKYVSNPKISVDSSKENSMNSSAEYDEKSLEITNNLHKYFSKIDKAPDICLKSNILKVEAIVHYPPSEEKVKPPKRLKTRLRRRKSLDLRPEYDIITSEEDNSNLQNSSNELSSANVTALERESTAEEIMTSSESLTETSENNDKINAKFEMDAEKYSTPVPVKFKNDGTLNSFFKSHNRIANRLLLELNEERKLAKQDFLNSGIPDSMKKVTNKKKELVLVESAPFPKLQHVTQADALSVMWNLKEIKLNFKPLQPFLINLPPWSSIVIQKSIIENLDVKNTATASSSQQKKILKALSKEVPDYPVKKWYTELSKMKVACENEMWTEKYKPKSALQLIGNSKNVEKLKSWLQMLNNDLKKGNVTYNSDEEFLRSEDESVEGTKITALLQGPSGVGKTASVYALAEEIGYQILEINSSCNRMGKKILHEFSEALQSHKVETNVLNFTGKKNKVDDYKKSLILIEDIDVIFLDYDEGFLSTIVNLAASSKRPIIFTINEFNHKYLAKVLPFTQFKLDFQPLPQGRLSGWIRTLAAVEGIELHEQMANELIKWANGDLRKLLLQLQFSTAKNKEMVYSEHQIQTNNVWERMSGNRFDTREQAKTTAKLCNLLVVSDLLNGALNSQLSSEDPARKPWHSILKFSSELHQPKESTDCPTRDMLADTIQILREKTSSQNGYHSLRYDDKTLVIPTIERDVLPYTSVLAHSSVATDYLPVLRTIARTENTRLAAHTKRNNRYFNYLQSIGITESTIKISNLLSQTLSSVV
ncbi:ATPase family AAA domain-containing protein 5-like isoform X2 [Rhodnius prolixus]|uniref:ATPase family AAA domain-containing protein 5-like isoform X2 n=1 Tax=Rhodnius prolixus TaxID=13249 RepID=UPI003D18F048